MWLGLLGMAMVVLLGRALWRERAVGNHGAEHTPVMTERADGQGPKAVYFGSHSAPSVVPVPPESSILGYATGELVELEPGPRGARFETAPAARASWQAFEEGDRFAWQAGPGYLIEGVVDSVVRGGRAFSFGVTLDDERGRMSFQHNIERQVAHIFFYGEREAHRLVFDDEGGTLERLRVSQMMCASDAATYPPRPEHLMPRYEVDDKKRVPMELAASLASSPAPFQSRPGAPTVIYCDFDGETVNQPYWSASPIVAAASSFSETEIALIMRIVAEDFAPFDVNVTNIRSVFDNAPSNRRVMCVSTPTDTASPGAGGVAGIDTFVDDIVCWNFNMDDVFSAADTISHEVGHTLNLEHDGINSGVGNDEYYEGHTADGNQLWGPIMGAAFDATIAQWSKGEYYVASRTQDDLALITSNGLSYRNDDYGNSNATAHAVQVNLVPVSVAGVIERSTDVDVFLLTVNEFAKIRLAGRSEPRVTNLDVRMQVIDTSDQSLLVDYSSDVSLEAEAEFVLAPGVYEVRLQGDASGSPFANPPTGWTSYGSLGNYTFVVTPDPPDRRNSIENMATLNDGGDAAWFAQSQTTFDGEDALQSGVIRDDQSSILTITNRTTSVSFRYRVSSEPSWDWLEFYIDGVRQNRWSGESGWGLYNDNSLSDAEHVFEWRYVKDGSISGGEDTAWIDELVFAGDVSYANWAAANGAAASSDQDGNSNGVADLAEYGLLDESGDETGVVLARSEGPSLEFYRNTERQDVIHRIQASVDFSTWQTVAVSYDSGNFVTAPGVSVTTTVISGTLERVRYEFDVTNRVGVARVMLSEKSL